MDLLEYQAKTLFRQMAIPVLPSQRIDFAHDLKGLTIPYPVVLKSQVRAGGRGKAGGIKFVENTIDAVAAAQCIFNLAIQDEYPQVLLAEAKYDADQEVYLAVILDPVTRRPLLLGSVQGGVNVEATMFHIQKVVVDQEFSPFYARRLMVKMGLQEHLILSVSNILEKMYRLFVEKDLDLVEINPLGISSTGELMALDGKVVANNQALERHPDLVMLVHEQCSDPAAIEPTDLPTNQPNFVKLDGNIGIICNGAALTMTTLDQIIATKGKPANFLNLGGEDHFEVTETLLQNLSDGLTSVMASDRIKVVMINWLGHQTTADQIAEAIANFLQHQKTIETLPHFVLRLTVTELESTLAKFAGLPVEIVATLDEAVKRTVALSR
ncbi:MULTISPECIES: ATP-grasp domain-containing protein [Arthrospira]|jgi:succinyl-CoA synthetase beta subunit|uniref:Succinyl-CoA synthetase beta chain n=1 Tax=Limnospira platensis NIES-46 TaxID=1236695 RepID=A0A5M3TC47_LIMPL|nr:MULTISPECIES: ATP-grasp domain-containing protein [Arthrospira]AMW28132.1 ATPase [Arthrospira platensis YZ]KDR57273.1 ATPase [Arthrospira platensis str. Paraca]MBD2671699.1 succinate--CoA ligase subunit beta [Arthrospira platensis FACHB-439]MBD2712640.1 succinate--CoA ligase subunit beta [Arthrospira platensis FACHB-835]MDF2209256.1 succinate--CoA ligase subunit beta [Arthrospira platensis NCB002]MDT9185232.1 succinate--CoA ligase subunit beta [Limnospira sp. PMC 289.06]MDT9297447.1 succi